MLRVYGRRAFYLGCSEKMCMMWKGALGVDRMCNESFDWRVKHNSIIRMSSMLSIETDSLLLKHGMYL